MLHYPSLRSRTIITSLYALCVTGLTYILFPAYFTANPKFLLAGGLWFLTVGFMVAQAGVITWLPLLNKRLKWYSRGPMIAAIMHVPLILWAHNILTDMLASHTLTAGWPTGLLFIIGYLIGMGMDVLATYYGGEGPVTLLADQYKTDKK